jgi:hypothetical protein
LGATISEATFSFNNYFLKVCNGIIIKKWEGSLIIKNIELEIERER